MELINKQSALKLFINKGTYRALRYSNRRKKHFSFSGYQIIFDKFIPKDKIICFGIDGRMRIIPVKEYLCERL